VRIGRRNADPRPNRRQSAEGNLLSFNDCRGIWVTPVGATPCLAVIGRIIVPAEKSP
jgi:hypothetical protein